MHHTTDSICPGCEEKLHQAHPVLVEWFHDSVKPTYPEAHVSWTFRDALDQDRAFKDGKTKLKFPNSMHNRIPARALDLFEIKAGKAVWDEDFFAHLADSIELAKLPIFWGGHYKHLGDRDHFQLASDNNQSSSTQSG